MAGASFRSNASDLDLSLPSFASGFSTPGRNLRHASGSTIASSAPLPTPSPPTAAQFTRRRLEEPTPVALGRRKSGLDDLDDNDGENILDTPGKEKSLHDSLDASAPGRPARTRSAGAKGGGINLTLRDQEKVHSSFSSGGLCVECIATI